MSGLLIKKKVQQFYGKSVQVFLKGKYAIKETSIKIQGISSYLCTFLLVPFYLDTFTLCHQ